MIQLSLFGNDPRDGSSEQSNRDSRLSLPLPKPSEHIIALMRAFRISSDPDVARERLRLLRRNNYDIPGGFGPTQISDEDAVEYLGMIQSHVLRRSDYGNDLRID